MRPSSYLVELSRSSVWPRFFLMVMGVVAGAMVVVVVLVARWWSIFPRITKDLIRWRATSRVESSMLAKQTLNHPGSQQWKDEPGETLSLTSLMMTLHSLSSPSNVGSSKRWRRSIHTKSPALLFKHPMPTCASWLVKWWCL
uniref:Uncharacterized protein n=1 Tax=Opuntia streptacantha TaxID=393608 RepID=A0A7C9E0P9_OPUST